MVWAEMVMGRNGHWPKWLWAEVPSDLIERQAVALLQVHERVIHRHFNEMGKNLNKIIWLEPE